MSKQIITCKSCGKLYDRKKDELCPHCGAYTSLRSSRDGGAEMHIHGILEDHSEKVCYEDDVRLPKEAHDNSTGDKVLGWFWDRSQDVLKARQGIHDLVEADKNSKETRGGHRPRLFRRPVTVIKIVVYLFVLIQVLPAIIELIRTLTH